MRQDATQARTVLAEAARVGDRTRAAGRWWSGYLALMGLSAFAVIVAVEVFFPSFGARLAATVGWAVATGLLGAWAQSRQVQPRGGWVGLLIATAAWFGMYLVLIGPVVRWQAGTSLGWWSAAAAVMALPFLVAAGYERRRR
ncbi:hypothetical protein [Micromonospora echinaurantiaca]|uniref:hypothetical protein n=1 Tax=Micromonospora echinaurantiaca TaxID=47857 RepID=UPI0037B079DA